MWIDTGRVTLMSELPISRLTVNDGTQIAYGRQGSGPTVILVHGGFLDHRAWGGLQAILVASGHTVVAPDRRGHGSSDPYAPGYDVADDAGDLAQIIAEVTDPGTGVRVIAHSSGCHSALAAAVLTDSIDDLVLYEPSLRRDPFVETETWNRLRDAHGSGNRPRLVELALTEVVGKATGERPPVPYPPSFWESPFGRLLLENALSIPVELEARSRQDDSDDSLRQITIPIKCLIGQKSPPYNREFSDHLSSLNALTQVIELADQDHGTPLSDPGVIAGLLAAFDQPKG